MYRTYSILLIIISLFFHQSLFAGWVIVEESADNFGNHSFQTTFIQHNLVRIEGTTTINILDLNKKELTLIFPSHRSFWKGTPQQLNEQTTQLIKQQFQSLLARAPASQKDTLRKIIQKLDSPDQNADSTLLLAEVKIQKTGKSLQIDGFKTYEYEVYVDNMLKETLWVTFDKSPYNELDVEKMLSFTRSISPMSKEGLISRSPAYVALLKKGMVVKSIEYHAHGLQQVTQVKRIKQMSISPDIFMPPPGYRLASIEEIMQMDLNTKLPGTADPLDKQNDPDELPQIPNL